MAGLVLQQAGQESPYTCAVCHGVLQKMSMMSYFWVAIKALVFGGSIVLQPSFATLSSKDQAFVAPPGSRIEAINDLATLTLRTDGLEQMKMNQLIGPNYMNVADELSLTSIRAFLVLDGRKVCQLRFVGFDVSETGSDAIYKCNDIDTSGMRFSEILMSSPRPVKIGSVKWNNAGK